MEDFDMLDIEELEDLNELNELNSENIGPARYQVWAFGYNDEEGEGLAENCIGDIILTEGEDPDELVVFVDSLRKADLKGQLPKNSKYAIIEIETVVDVEDDGEENIGTIYLRRIILDDALESKVE